MQQVLSKELREIPADIESVVFDLAVIGAGINGCGIARDAAMRGLKVVLLDKADVGGGTTSWSTRLIHGGLRYLEHAEVGLVRESLRERERLLKLAPHLVRPLAMLIPIYARGRRGPLTIRAGMIAYDLLSFDKSLSHHHMLSRAETLERAPGLDERGLLGASLYYDAQVEYPERLALENALSARDHGASVLTYTRVDHFALDGGSGVSGLEVTDTLSGNAFNIRARVFVNASGPWVDEVLARAGDPAHRPRLIGGTKGSHIVTRAFPGAPADALYVEAVEDGRPFFIIPWNDLYLIGTTDIRFKGNLNAVEADACEIEYLLRETNRVIPSARLTIDSVLYTYSGVRPLPFHEEGAPNSKITRRHFIHDHAPRLSNLLSIVGGKLTTYRNLSEQAVNLVFKKLGRARPPCETAQVALPGARTHDFRAFAASFGEGTWLTEASRRHLLRVYGTRAAKVIEAAVLDDELGKIIDDATGAIGAEVIFSFRDEMAGTLTDCFMRRTMIGMGPGAGLQSLEAAARIACRYLGWDEGLARREVDDYLAYIKRFHVRSQRAEEERQGSSLPLHT